MTSRERHITRLTSLSNITTVAYTASCVRWERFRVYFCRAYKLFVETFCFVANANIITTVAYTASRVHWERFCVSFKTKSERTTCLLYNVLLYNVLFRLDIDFCGYLMLFDILGPCTKNTPIHPLQTAQVLVGGSLLAGPARSAGSR